MNIDHLPKTLLWAGGIAAIVTAFTTFLLWYLPTTYSIADGFDDVIALHQEPAYMGRLWVNYVHVFFALFAYGVVAAALWRKSPVWAMIGFIAFAFWCLTEAMGVSINIWAVNESWRAGFMAADETQQTVIKTSLHTFSGIWYGLFFVILWTFLIATFCYSMALWGGGRLQKLLSVLFFLAVPLTLIIIADSYFGASLSRWIEWSYPILQPLSRALMGIWLIRLATRTTPSSA